MNITQEYEQKHNYLGYGSSVESPIGDNCTRSHTNLIRPDVHESKNKLFIFLAFCFFFVLYQKLLDGISYIVVPITLPNGMINDQIFCVIKVNGMRDQLNASVMRCVK